MNIYEKLVREQDATEKIENKEEYCSCDRGEKFWSGIFGEYFITKMQIQIRIVEKQ